MEWVLEGTLTRRDARMWKSGRRDIQLFLEPPPPNDTKGAASIDVVMCTPKEPSCSNRMIKEGQEAGVRLIQVNARAALKLLRTFLT